MAAWPTGSVGGGDAGSAIGGAAGSDLASEGTYARALSGAGPWKARQHEPESTEQSDASDLIVPASTSLLIIVSGLPGSGKSTLGRQIAGRLGVPFLDKDDYLEDLFETDNVSSEQRSELSRRADELMLADVAESVSSVIVSFWRRSELSQTSGTPTDRFPSRDDVVELWCDCPVNVAVDRFLSRRRHRAHGDDSKSHAEILGQFERLADLGPLEVGRVVRADTAGPVDIASLLELIVSTH